MLLELWLIGGAPQPGTDPIFAAANALLDQTWDLGFPQGIHVSGTDINTLDPIANVHQQVSPNPTPQAVAALAGILASTPIAHGYDPLVPRPNEFFGIDLKTADRSTWWEQTAGLFINNVVRSDDLAAIQAVPDLHTFDQAIKSLIDKTDQGNATTFANQPFSRHVIADLAKELALPGSFVSCCDNPATLPPAQLEPPAVTAPNVTDPNVQAFMTYCGACHVGGHFDFLSGLNEIEVRAKIRLQAAKIMSTIDWEHNPDITMPPTASSQYSALSSAAASTRLAMISFVQSFQAPAQ